MAKNYFDCPVHLLNGQSFRIPDLYFITCISRAR